MAGARIPPDALGDELARIYADADRRLRLLIRQTLERGADASAAYRERQLLHVAIALAKLRRDGAGAAAEAIRRAYRAGAIATDRATGLTAGFGGVHERAVAILAANTVTSLDQAAQLVGRRTADAFRKPALQEVAAGIATGAGRREVSAALERRLVQDGVTDALTGFVDIRGRRWALGTYAEMVARTTTREAVTEGTINRMGDHELDLVTISEHPDSCAICLPYQGRTYSISGKDRRYPRLVRRTPLHPRCRHVTTPSAVNFEDFERELGLRRAA